MQTAALYEGHQLPYYSGVCSAVLCDLVEKKLDKYASEYRYPGALKQKYGENGESCLRKDV